MFKDGEPTYFGLSELGKRIFGWERKVDGKKAHWMKLPLDFFEDDIVLNLPDSQKLVLIGVGILCLRRNNRVRFHKGFVRKMLNSRVYPDLDLFLECALIEHEGTEKRGEEKRREESKSIEPTYEPPEDVKAETAIKAGTVTLERRLLAAVSKLAGKVTPERDELSIMREVTAYKRGDGTLVAGRANPSGMTAERLEKSLADAEAWLSDLEKAS